MARVATKLGRYFGGLKVRYKLMVLHNLFFVVLSAGVYVAVMPVIENWAAEEQAREAVRSETVDGQYYESVLRRIWINIFAVLALTYWLGVAILEGVVMRQYIYRPLRILLAADEASLRGDRARELIDESLILGDELGHLMSSRNATIHRLRQHEQELERALQRLEEAAKDLRRKNTLLATAKQNIAAQDRLASLGMLAASLAHEINTPLAVLQGSVEKLIEAAPDDAARARLERILRVSARLQKISDSMLDFTRVRTDNFESISIRPVIEEAWELVSIDERAKLVRFEDGTQRGDCVLGNADRLTQLFVNLLRNSLSVIPADGEISVACERSAENLLIRVDDNGPGIPDDLLPNIFEAFVTTRLDSRGTGLGLAVAEGIAEQHGGAIRAVNRPEGGARLEVRLSAAVSPPAAGERDRGDPAAGRQS